MKKLWPKWQSWSRKLLKINNSTNQGCRKLFMKLKILPSKTKM